MREELQRITELMDTSQLEQAQQQLIHLIEQQADCAQLHYLLGQTYYRQQQWGKAINAFNEVLALEPNHPDAQSQIDMANSILGYFTPDMFNP
ncbi:tetratricopeptide repeat protein [Sunxiuqinia sp. sy24]|uniref:tetratricopeptide repeat protein n=1 Tax=Sunxiuqinia sp. sy24 TaxID=3461495 RepID=UPI0040458017